MKPTLLFNTAWYFFSLIRCLSSCFLTHIHTIHCNRKRCSIYILSLLVRIFENYSFSNFLYWKHNKQSNNDFDVKKNIGKPSVGVVQSKGFQPRTEWPPVRTYFNISEMKLSITCRCMLYLMPVSMTLIGLKTAMWLIALFQRYSRANRVNH